MMEITMATNGLNWWGRAVLTADTVRSLMVVTVPETSEFATGIIHGEKAPENSMQYMVSVQDNKGRHVCGGFLITEDFVLTSAHCDDFNPAYVVLGNHNLKKADHQKIRIEKKIIHQRYANIQHGNDIMLLQLSEKVRLGHRVQTVQLPPAEINLQENQVCQVAGWGKTKPDGESVDELRVVDVSVVKPKVCDKQWPGLPANVTCAGGYKTTKGFCQGDSGGPLVCDRFAVGLVSFNYESNCNYPNKPNVYTDISKYRRWIDEVLRQNPNPELLAGQILFISCGGFLGLPLKDTQRYATLNRFPHLFMFPYHHECL
ncbi:granzyme B(G,H)-like [Pelmatolapia mariae]|uniref:granzyme B(G,H)-like n=1 Tax=Pelmatolapia mariae TaxID=158779 RepID=UPI002FE528C7